MTTPNNKSNDILKYKEGITISNNRNHQKLFNSLKVFQNNDRSITLSIVIPIHNEESTIQDIIERLPKNDSIEIIAINDYSTDNSQKELEKIKAQKQIKVINHHQNMGYGAAIISGITKSKGKIILTIDADGQHDPDDILTVIQPILNGEADYSIGSRYLGSYNYKLPIVTRLGEAIIEKTISFFFNVKVVNNQSGFRAFNRKMIHIFNNINYKGFAFATEVILKASIYKFKIIECPIKLNDRIHGHSKIVLRVLLRDLLLCIARYYLIKIKNLIFMKKRAKSVC